MYLKINPNGTVPTLRDGDQMTGIVDGTREGLAAYTARLTIRPAFRRTAAD